MFAFVIVVIVFICLFVKSNSPTDKKEKSFTSDDPVVNKLKNLTFMERSKIVYKTNMLPYDGEAPEQWYKRMAEKLTVDRIDMILSIK